MTEPHDSLARLASTFAAAEAAWNARDNAEASRLADATLGDWRTLREPHPILFGRGIELVADLRRAAGGGPNLGPGDRDVLDLYRESVLARQDPSVAKSDEVAIASLKAALTAHGLGDASATIASLASAVACETGYPTTVAREALATFAARRGEYAEALAHLGPKESWSSFRVDFQAGLFFRLGRYREACALWEQVEDPFRSTARLHQAWALHRAGECEARDKKLRGLKGSALFYLSPEGNLALEYLRALAAGEDAVRPESFDPEWGLVPRPSDDEVRLEVFANLRPLAIAMVSSQLELLAHGETLELARRYVAEAGLLGRSGEESERREARTRLAAALRILDRERGPHHPDTTPILRKLFLEPGSHPDESREAGARFLENVEKNGASIEELASAEYVASTLALRLLETDAPAATALARKWLELCKAGGGRPSRLAHTVATTEWRSGHGEQALSALREALELLDPDDWEFERQSFAWKEELVDLARKVGAPDDAVERELVDARARWASEWSAGLRKRSREHGVVALLTPYLMPGQRFSRVPFSVMEAVASVLGVAFTRSRVNARPSHRALLDACRAHADATTFAGSIAQGVEVDSVDTDDTPALRKAFASADDLRLLAGRLHAWWD